ncbi:uncharacterized protein I206_104933 [Kwoniella pini CBS 10737]|uniref:BZIP domain-containing protein n=1 Tax=Kwoniella pini CBS 10737 TaxID=1296096 RepID=A0A1B9I875_9TREE|nr:uncharacterized protein I206_02474 [Kwoniella pini CBS 10737]OCF51758.1 hypothetical protein I206_02474 [Kwoniella pini CBS 10737]
MSTAKHEQGSRSPSHSTKRRAASPSSSHASDHSPTQWSPLSPENDYHPNHSNQYSTGLPTGTPSVRRREANRLAAQRFRSRKKGYQDSLEERIRILESEKEVLIRQLDESLSHSGRSSSSLQSRSSNVRRNQIDGEVIDSPLWPASSSKRRSHSPDGGKPLDADVRIASLESANRRLQDDVRNLFEENEQLKDELRKWQRWSRDNGREDPPNYPEYSDQRHTTPRSREIVNGGPLPHQRMPEIVGDQRRNNSHHLDADHDHHSKSANGDRLRPSLPPLERPIGHLNGPPLSSPFIRPPFDHSESFSRSTQPNGHSINILLAPLRLPPIRTALSPNTMTTTLPSPRNHSGGSLVDRPLQQEKNR